jgi:GDP-4-dehydro-6-deoxy-D-mannose reductase
VPGHPLVTGATGFAGSHLVDLLLEEERSVAAWAHLRPREWHTDRNDSVQWNSVDLLDRQGVATALSDLRPSVIYHCGGIAHVGESWSQPVRALSVNVLGTHHLLEGVRDAGLDCPVIVIGSALVYRPSTEVIGEEASIGPSDPYGVSKLAQEMLAARALHVPVFIVRPFNHAGPRQSPTYATSSFARQIAEIEAGRREPLLRVGNLDSRRDITDVRDTVRAYRLVVAHGKPGRPYNVCSGHAYCIRDLLETLLRASRTAIRVEVETDRLRPSDNPVITGNRTRISTETGWEPRIPINRTLEDLLDYWRLQTSRQS